MNVVVISHQFSEMLIPTCVLVGTGMRSRVLDKLITIVGEGSKGREHFRGCPLEVCHQSSASWRFAHRRFACCMADGIIVLGRIHDFF